MPYEVYKGARQPHPTTPCLEKTGLAFTASKLSKRLISQLVEEDIDATLAKLCNRLQASAKIARSQSLEKLEERLKDFKKNFLENIVLLSWFATTAINYQGKLRFFYQTKPKASSLLRSRM
ncbi:MAG: hypothetical protein D6756_12925 [Cyanobacteria bacterium J083]|nr:MAG: hypothetical protein D6756_12925 [Cyanobacteria bacterium J083]